MSEDFDTYHVYASVMDENWQKELHYRLLEVVKPGLPWRITYQYYVDLYHREISRLKTCAGFNIRVSCVNTTRRQVEAYCDICDGTIRQSVQECWEDLFR